MLPVNKPFRFCADVHLGKLARSLRMIGFDTFYKNDLSREELYLAAKNENRILLSKRNFFNIFPDIEFFKINSYDPTKQLIEVIRNFQLQNFFKPFTLCLNCNEKLEERSKSLVEEDLLPNTKDNFSDFFQCPSCHKIYWKGSHYDRMNRQIENLKNFQNEH